MSLIFFPPVRHLFNLCCAILQVCVCNVDVGLGKTILDLLTTGGPWSPETTDDQETFRVTHYLHSPCTNITTHVLRTRAPFQEPLLNHPLSGS